MQYVASAPAGAASITAAVAALIGIAQPASATMASAKINQMMVGPGANSADNNYSVRLRRATTATTWTTAITPSNTGPTASTSNTLCNAASNTTRGTLTAGNIGSWGFHMRGGMAWTAIPGGEIQLLFVFVAGLELEYFFVQGTDVLEPTIMYQE